MSGELYTFWGRVPRAYELVASLYLLEPVAGRGRRAIDALELERGNQVRETELMNELAASRTGTGNLPPDVVEQIRSSNDAWHRRDLEAALAPYADEIEWDTTDAYPDGQVYRGMPALRSYFDEVLERWGEEQHRLEIQEIFVVDRTSIVLVHYRMLGRSHSGVPIDAGWVHVFEFRDGKILRARNFTSPDAAMESLGAARLTQIWKPRGD